MTGPKTIAGKGVFQMAKVVAGILRLIGELRPPPVTSTARRSVSRVRQNPQEKCVLIAKSSALFEDLWSRLDGRLPANLEMCRTAPSSAVRATVPLLEATKPFEPQIEAAKEAFRAAEVILQLWPQIRQAAGFPPLVPNRSEQAWIP